MNRILVTGCSGFLASHLMKLLQRQERNKVFGITEVPGFIYPDVEVFQVDIRRRDDISHVLGIIRPAVTFHLAAVTNVGFAWKNPQLTYDVNFMGTSNLLEALQASAPDSRLLLMSSAEVYRTGGEEPIGENSPTVCQNPYALSKLAMEMLSEAEAGLREKLEKADEGRREAEARQRKGRDQAGGQQAGGPHQGPAQQREVARESRGERGSAWQAPAAPSGC